MVRIRGVETLDGFRVRLSLTDGSTREVDLGRYLNGPVFEPARNNRAEGVEGDRHDAVDRGFAASQQRQDAADEDGCLAGAGAGLDQQRGLEVGDDAVAGLVVPGCGAGGAHGHALARARFDGGRLGQPRPGSGS